MNNDLFGQENEEQNIEMENMEKVDVEEQQNQIE